MSCGSPARTRFWRCGRAEPGGDRAARDLDDHRAAGGAQLDRHRWPAGIAVVQEERGREGEPVAAELVAVGGLGHVPDPPPADGVEDRLQLRARVGQVEQGGCDGRRGVFSPDQARGLEFTDPVREQVGRDPRQSVLQVGVPARAADHELPDDQQGPPVADDVQRLGDRAVLAVTTHNPSLADVWLIPKSNNLTF